MAVQQRVALLVDHALDLDRHIACRAHLGGSFRIELALAQPGYHHVVVALSSKPLQVGLSGNARVHHHRGPARRAQAGEHLRQRGRLTGIAGEHPAATREPAAVQHHGQGHQRAVAAALLAVASLGFGDSGGDALEVSVGEVIQRDGLAKAEDRLRLGEQVVLQGLAVLVQRVGCAVQAVEVHRLEVEVHQLAQGRALRQPGVRGQLAAGVDHPANDAAHGSGNLRAV